MLGVAIDGHRLFGHLHELYTTCSRDIPQVWPLQWPWEHLIHSKRMPLPRGTFNVCRDSWGCRRDVTSIHSIL